MITKPFLCALPQLEQELKEKFALPLADIVQDHIASGPSPVVETSIKGIYAGREHGMLAPETEKKFEYHKQYYDIHILLKGNESIISSENPLPLHENGQLDPNGIPQQDYFLLPDCSHSSLERVSLKPMTAFVIPPGYLHKACVGISTDNEADYYEKLVVKIYAPVIKQR